MVLQKISPLFKYIECSVKDKNTLDFEKITESMTFIVTLRNHKTKARDDAFCRVFKLRQDIL